MRIATVDPASVFAVQTSRFSRIPIRISRIQGSEIPDSVSDNFHRVACFDLCSSSKGAGEASARQLGMPSTCRYHQESARSSAIGRRLWAVRRPAPGLDALLPSRVRLKLSLLIREAKHVAYRPILVRLPAERSCPSASCLDHLPSWFCRPGCGHKVTADGAYAIQCRNMRTL